MEYAALSRSLLYFVTISVSCAHIVSVSPTELSYDCGCSPVAVYSQVLLRVKIKQMVHSEERGQSAGEKPEVIRHCHVSPAGGRYQRPHVLWVAGENLSRLMWLQMTPDWLLKYCVAEVLGQ